MMKSEPKAGVEFNACTSKEGVRSCAFCSIEQREKCELLARLDLRYSDDPRNANYDRR